MWTYITLFDLDQERKSQLPLIFDETQACGCWQGMILTKIVLKHLESLRKRVQVARSCALRWRPTAGMAPAANGPIFGRDAEVERADPSRYF